jgi:hypothetical protein
MHVGPTPLVRAEGDGSLKIIGEDRETVGLDAHGEVEIQRTEEGVHLRIDGRAVVLVPSGSRLEIPTLEDALEVGRIDGPIQIGVVGGSLVLAGVGPTTVDQVGSGLRAHDVTGDLNVESVGGAAAVHDVGGSVRLPQVGGSARIHDIGGNLHVVAGGSAAVTLDPRPDHTYDVTAGGSVRCVLGDEANADVEIASGAGAIAVDFPAARVAKGRGMRVFTLGSGGAKIRLSGGGAVRVTRASGGEEEGFVNVDFERKMEEFGRAMSAWGEAFGNEFGTVGEQLAERISRAVDSAQQRAQRKIERQLARGARHGVVIRPHVPAHGAPPPRPPLPPAAPGFASRPAEPVRDEERRLILRMLADGKITADQADDLLAALGNAAGR